MRIGIDFDNTIVRYDHIFAAEAKMRGLTDEDFHSTKTEIRDHIRTMADGETEWQRLQGRVYGALMADAKLIDGAGEFLAQGRIMNLDIFIVSHKTQFGHFDPDRVDLRKQALAWMSDKGFFDAGGFALPKKNVYFESTRVEKVARIEALGCTHFIDDLVEVFEEPGFPDGVRRALFHPGDNPPEGPFEVYRSWQDINDDFLGAAR